jgi:uncharacterized protein (DUF2141 family)
MLIFLTLVSLLISPISPQARKTVVTVEVHNVRAASGKVEIGLFKPCSGFPDKCKPTESRQVTATKGVVQAVFEVDPGEYALAVYHDVNGNGKIDMRFFIPKEPYGFSNNVRPRFSAPTFADCQVQIGHEPKTLTVRIE